MNGDDYINLQYNKQICKLKIPKKKNLLFDHFFNQQKNQQKKHKNYVTKVNWKAINRFKNRK